MLRTDCRPAEAATIWLIQLQNCLLAAKLSNHSGRHIRPSGDTGTCDTLAF